MNWLIVTITIFMSSAAVAGDGQQVSVASAQTRFFKDSAGYHISSPDGRELTVYEYIRPAKDIKITLKQIENTCNRDQELAECDFALDFAPFHYLLVWTKHSDPAKIGMVAENGKVSLPINYYASFKVPALAPIFKPDRLACNHYQWTEGMRKTSQGSLIVDSWSSELMLENPETSVNENQTLADGFEVLLKPLMDKYLEVVGVKSDYQIFPIDSTPYLSTQVSNLNFVSEKNEVCQVSFESSIGNASSILSSPYFNEVDMTNIKPAKEIIPGLYIQLKGTIQLQMSVLNSSLNGGNQ